LSAPLIWIACDGNEPLRRAVESLLKSHEETGNFVDAPAFEAAAEMLLGGEELKSGQRFAQIRQNRDLSAPVSSGKAET
jgi:hypothetical protein